MGFRHGLRLAVGQLGLIGCGMLTLIAWRAGLYANVALLVLVSLWIAGETVWRASIAPLDRPRAAPPVVSAPDPDRASAWRAYVDQTPAPLIALQADGVLRAVNRAARALFRTDDRVVDPPQALLSGLNATDAKERRSLSLQTASGRRAFALQTSDIADEAGVTRLGALVDIDAEIHAAEAKALRDLLAVLSHEIMNSLTPVASLAETAADYLEGETSAPARAAREAVTILARRAGSLARFVEAYRSLARLPPPALRPTPLARLLAETGEVFRASWGARGVALQIEPPAADLIVDLDPDLMTQALLNLLTNAAEAALQTASAPTVRLSAQIFAGRADVRVEDNGAGVPPDLRDSLFQPFVTTKPQGAGIGLNLARQIALSHGGDLTLVPTQQGRGAVFRLEV